MSRYIEADAVITAIAEFNKYEDELEYPYASDDLEEYKDDARLLIEDAPSIDIVRCKDCKFNYGNEHNCSFNPNDIVCTYWESDGLQSDDFCSMGERSE